MLTSGCQKPGCWSRVVRATSSLVFLSTEVTVDKRVIAMANGVFKILRQES